MAVNRYKCRYLSEFEQAKGKIDVTKEVTRRRRELVLFLHD